MREIAHLAKADVQPIEINGKQLWTVTIAGKQVCTFTDNGKVCAKERAEASSKLINQLLNNRLCPPDISIDSEACTLKGCGKIILSITANDSDASGKPISQLLDEAAGAIQYAIWSDWIRTEQSEQEEYIVERY
jgi:hypothetical protein